MGRPLNKRNFGSTSANAEIKVRFADADGTGNGWIVKQLATKKFRVTDGTKVVDCYLVDKTGVLNPGEMSISIKDDIGNVQKVVKIAAHKVTAGTTGQSIGWNFDSSTVDEAVQIAETAGQTSDTILTVAEIIAGNTYVIVDLGDTAWDIVTGLLGQAVVGQVFVAASSGTGTGTVNEVIPETTFST